MQKIRHKLDERSGRVHRARLDDRPHNREVSRFRLCTGRVHAGDVVDPPCDQRRCRRLGGDGEDEGRGDPGEEVRCEDG